MSKIIIDNNTDLPDFDILQYITQTVRLGEVNGLFESSYIYTDKTYYLTGVCIDGVSRFVFEPVINQ